MTVSCRTGVISRAGAEYFSLVKIMVANFDFTAGESWGEKDGCTKIVNDG